MRKSSERDNTFSLPSNRRLTKELGEFDALAEYLYVSHLSFVQSSKARNMDFKQYLMDTGKHFNIHIKDLTINDPDIQMMLLFLFLPIACFDKFVSELGDEVCDLINPDYKLGTEGTKLNKLLNGLSNIGVNIIVPQLYVDIFEYYRICRNVHAHAGKEKDITAKYQKIDKNSALKIVPRWQNALQEAHYLTISDVVLCSAIVKRIADLIVTKLYQYISWDKVNYDHFPETKQLRLRLKREQKDKIKYLNLFISSTFGITLSDTVLDQIQKLLLT